MQATARMASVVSSMLSARRRLIRSVRPPETELRNERPIHRQEALNADTDPKALRSRIIFLPETNGLLRL